MINEAQEAIQIRLKGLKGKLERTKTMKEKRETGSYMASKNQGEIERLEKEIRFLKYLLNE